MKYHINPTKGNLHITADESEQKELVKGECVWQGGEAEGYEKPDAHTGLFPSALYWASFNHFEMRMPGQCVIDCSQPGQDASDDVKAWKDRIVAQIAADAFPNAPTPDSIRAELKEYGAWDDAELADDEANMERLIWCAANNIREDDAPDCSLPVKPATAPVTPAHASQFEVEQYTAPSSWASYLINGDDSGIDEKEKIAADQFVSRIGCGAPVGCEDAGFRQRNDAGTLAGDCQTYAFLRRK